MSYYVQHEHRRDGSERWLVFDEIGHCRAYCTSEDEANEIIRHANAVDSGEMNVMLIPRDPSVS